jgi:hypothetical protein
MKGPAKLSGAGRELDGLGFLGRAAGTAAGQVKCLVTAGEVGVERSVERGMMGQRGAQRGIGGR